MKSIPIVVLLVSDLELSHWRSCTLAENDTLNFQQNILFARFRSVKEISNSHAYDTGARIITRIVLGSRGRGHDEERAYFDFVCAKRSSTGLMSVTNQ